MFLGGLWHGASWMFVAWGLYHGALLAGYHTVRRWSGVVLPMGVCRAGVCLAVAIGWVPFRSPDHHFARAWYHSLAGLGATGSPAALGSSFLALLLLSAAWIAFVPEPWEMNLAPKRRYGIALATVLTLCILFLARQSPFLYFQF
jgi:D-alanyl-lipoteichoic acid acyltransferase DltB (MBOAT superfamily)